MSPQALVEGLREFAVSVMDQITFAQQKAVKVIRELAGTLHH
jgi:hypothetical protein